MFSNLLGQVPTLLAEAQAAPEQHERIREAVRDAIEREIDRGAKEIVLTGVDITLAELEGTMLGVTGLSIVALSVAASAASLPTA